MELQIDPRPFEYQGVTMLLSPLHCPIDEVGYQIQPVHWNGIDPPNKPPIVYVRGRWDNKNNCPIYTISYKRGRKERKSAVHTGYPNNVDAESSLLQALALTARLGRGDEQRLNGIAKMAASVQKVLDTLVHRGD